MQTLYWTFKLIFSIIIVYSIFLAYFKMQARCSAKLKRGNVKRLLKDEAQKLGINSKVIKYKFIDRKKSYSKLLGKTYVIYFGTNSLESTVKHELFHIWRGDCDNHGKGILNYLRIKLLYFLLFEPRATLYEAYGLKLGKLMNH